MIISMHSSILLACSIIRDSIMSARELPESKTFSHSISMEKGLYMLLGELNVSAIDSI